MILNPHLNDFEQTVLITGAAKRIGAVIAKTLTREKLTIAIHYHQSKKEAINLKNEIIESGGKAEIFQADLTQRNQIIGLIPEIEKKLPPITALINNASIFEWEEWRDVDFESWDKHIITNLEAPFWLSQAMAKNLPKNYHGAIINMLDQRVLKLTPYFTSYTVAKSALWSLTRTLALSLAPRIRVNAIGPGPTLANEMQSAQEFKNQYERTPLAQPIPICEIGESVLFLLKQTSITGQIIAIDGGEHLGWAQEKK